jgi:hypothetical protein
VRHLRRLARYTPQESKRENTRAILSVPNGAIFSGGRFRAAVLSKLPHGGSEGSREAQTGAGVASADTRCLMEAPAAPPTEESVAIIVRFSLTALLARPRKNPV